MRLLRQPIGLAHRLIGNTVIGNYLARKAGNQIAAIIRAGLNDGISMEDNGELSLIECVAPHAQCFIDVGANIGNWTKAFLGAGKSTVRGFLFEPSPEAVKELRKTFKSEITDGRIEILPLALSSETGIKGFFVEAGCGETSSLSKAASRADAQEISATVSTIDVEMKKLGDPHIDVLKIDAEGYDLQIIKGARESIEKRRISLIQFEYNLSWADSGSTLRDALNLLEKNEYSVYLLLRNGLQRYKYHPYGEFFGYANFVAVSSTNQRNVHRFIKG